MSNLFIVSVCTNDGWKNPKVFDEEQQRPEMELYILENQMKKHTVTSIFIPGLCVSALQDFFFKD
jgi:hypothetical protein